MQQRHFIHTHQPTLMTSAAVQQRTRLRRIFGAVGAAFAAVVLLRV